MTDHGCSGKCSNGSRGRQGVNREEAGMPKSITQRHLHIRLADPGEGSHCGKSSVSSGRWSTSSSTSDHSARERGGSVVLPIPTLSDSKICLFGSEILPLNSHAYTQGLPRIARSPTSQAPLSSQPASHPTYSQPATSQALSTLEAGFRTYGHCCGKGPPRKTVSLYSLADLVPPDPSTSRRQLSPLSISD